MIAIEVNRREIIITKTAIIPDTQKNPGLEDRVLWIQIDSPKNPHVKCAEKNVGISHSSYHCSRSFQ